MVQLLEERSLSNFGLLSPPGFGSLTPGQGPTEDLDAFQRTFVYGLSFNSILNLLQLLLQLDLSRAQVCVISQVCVKLKVQESAIS